MCVAYQEPVDDSSSSAQIVVDDENHGEAP